MKKKVYLSLIEGQADQDVAMGLLDGVEFEELYINYHERMSEWSLEDYEVSIELPDEPVGVEVVPGVYATWIGAHDDYKYKNVIKNLSEKGVLEWTEGVVYIPSERSRSGNLLIAQAYRYLVCERKDGVYKYCMYTEDGFKEAFGRYGIRAVKSND